VQYFLYLPILLSLLQEKLLFCNYFFILIEFFFSVYVCFLSVIAELVSLWNWLLVLGKVSNTDVGYSSIKGMIILTQVSYKYDGKVRIGVMWVEIGSGDGL